jgi:hypothetical protein
MSLEFAPQRQRRSAQSTRYLTKELVRQRYGWQSRLSVDRAWQKYRTLPPPTTYQGKHPLWAEHVLDAVDAENQQSTVPFSEARKEAQRLHLDRVRQKRARKRKRSRAAFAK